MKQPAPQIYTIAIPNIDSMPYTLSPSYYPNLPHAGPSILHRMLSNQYFPMIENALLVIHSKV